MDSAIKAPIKLTEWAMLARNYDDVKDRITFPILAQPKLNGVRAMWHAASHCFISRQGKIFPEAALPGIYARAIGEYPQGYNLDGELFCHNMPFQEIAGICSPNRVTPHPNHEKIEFWAFDVIRNTVAFDRLKLLDEYIGEIFPAVTHRMLYNSEEVELYLTEQLEKGYEGVMLRDVNSKYVVGRTDCLIKLKPWIFEKAKIIGFNKGRGKYIDTLGTITYCLAINDAYVMQFNFKASGGLDDNQRDNIWQNKSSYLGRISMVKFREKSKSGIPLQPQIHEL